ncbi:MAG: class I SAM-dependent methyltransferase [bacterium]|nr:class I SAM-dependent methyltransferase [bacterium]
MWDRLYQHLRSLFQAPEQILRHIEDGTTVLDLGCGYGDLCAALVTQKPACSATGIDHDIHKIQVAQSRYGNHPKLQFEVSDLQHVESVHQQIVLMIDVLHYFEATAQMDCLKKLATSASVQKIIARDTLRSWHMGYYLTRLHEFTMIRIGRTRVQQTRLTFFSKEEWRQIAHALNLKVQFIKSGLPFYNDHLIILSRS